MTSGPPGDVRSIRIFPELRQAHIEELRGPAERVTFFLKRKYDLTGGPIPTNYIPTTLPRLCWNLWTSPARRLELPEPLWLRFLPTWFILACVWKSRLARHSCRHAEIVTYAIENCPPSRLLPGPPHVAVLFRHTLGRILGRLISRCAFGSHRSHRVYGELVRLTTVDVRVVPDLMPPRSAAAKTPGTVAFVGALEERKGLRLLLNSWESVENAIPEAVLTVVGDGPLRRSVSHWAASKPMSRRWLGSLTRSDVLDELDRHVILVAPSIPEGHWREQIGRPIQEALACGATVVTSDETGLADFLRLTGHFVVPAAELADQLAPTIIHALHQPIAASEVHGTLPTMPGRVVADLWLHDE